MNRRVAAVESKRLDLDAIPYIPGVRLVIQMDTQAGNLA